MAKVSREDSNNQMVGVSNKAAGGAPSLHWGRLVVSVGVLLQPLALSLPSVPLQDSCLELVDEVRGWGFQAAPLLEILGQYNFAGGQPCCRFPCHFC